MAYEATYRFARISARKVRPLADLIRGKLADDALDILKFQPHRRAGQGQFHPQTQKTLEQGDRPAAKVAAVRATKDQIERRLWEDH